MAGNNENILVDFDYQNIVLVDPNKTINNEGKVNERLLKHEDLVYYANLEANLLPRTRLSVKDNGNIQNEKISIATVNFLKPGNKTFLTNEYLDEITGLSSLNDQTNRDKTQSSENKNYSPQENIDYRDTELLLINQIKVDIDLAGFPVVDLQLEDIRGRALFEKGEKSPYSVFFNYPYPIFYLTLKGYLGKAIKYQLALRKFNTRFDYNSGNFKIDVQFYAYKYNVLTSLPMKYLLSLPYMYKNKYKITTTDNGTGTDKGNVVEIPVSKGYQKIKEVYSEYKAKGIIDNNFPEITIQELITRLESLEKNLLNTFTQVDLQPLTDASNFSELLTKYEGDVFFYRPSWFTRYLDEKNFLIDKQGRKIYTFKKSVREGVNQTLVATTELKSIINKYNTELSQNATFGINGGTNSIRNQITYETVAISIKPDDIDREKSYYQVTGREPSIDTSGFTQFNNDLNVLLTNIVLTTEVPYGWFYFEGTNSFTFQIDNMQNQLNTTVDRIEKDLASKLSDRLQDPISGLGFRPTIRNIIAVLMASSEGFLRLMCDVHAQAWLVRNEKIRLQAIIDENKTVQSVDAKDVVQLSSGNLQPIYPWPQYFVETADDKGERFVLAYPGDSRYISKTKGYLYNIWPEVQFVEEFLKGRVSNSTNPTPTLGTNDAQIINRVSLEALDFPLSNIIFANKQETKFFFEIWERVFLAANYERLQKPETEKLLADLVAETEFLNLQNALLSENPYIIQKLKNYGFNSNNIIPFLAQISNSSIGESWQKYIRGIFVTPYIQEEVNNSFVILDNSTVAPGINVVKPEPTQLNKLVDYLKTQKSNVFDFTDTFPFNGISSWFTTGLADGNKSSNSDLLNTTQTLFVNTDKKMIASFQPTTNSKEIRPITNFNFYTITQPNTTVIELQNFYSGRTTTDGLKNQLPTEGTVLYKNYSGNVSNVQTTSILNTPFFVNSIQEGVTKWRNNVQNPYVSSAYLFLNSLPIATLREKFKTYNGTSTTDLDYIFSTLKKFGAIHKLPYAWVLKYGSIWHRYKQWTENGTDILQNVWNDYDATNNFDPVTNNPQKTYNLTINGSGESVTLSSILNPDPNTNIYNMNVGFYPQLINDFNVFYRGVDLFTGYTDSDIQNQLNTSEGFTMTYIDSASFSKSKGYNPSDPNNELRFRTWACTLNDTKKGKQFVVPSFGNKLNQVLGECFDNNGKFLQNVFNNNSVLNGSVRTFWSLPNYGYFNYAQIDKPSPQQYMKTIFFDTPQQEAFSLGIDTAYTSIEETFSVFSREILDIMESEFLKFSDSMYDYVVQTVRENTVSRVVIDTLPSDTNIVFKNFQLLMKEILTVSQSTNFDNESFVDSVSTNQLSGTTNTIQRFLEYDIVMKFSNPSNFNRRLFDSFSNTQFIEDRLRFNPYVPNSLPTSGGTTTLLQSKTAYPQTWKDLETYVGFSNVSGLTYTNSGSAITDFFVDMNIEFNSDSVQTLAPLIKIYATQKTINPLYNSTLFRQDIDRYLDNNKRFTDTVLNSLFAKVQRNLPDIEIIEEESTTVLQGEQTKLSLWESFKALNDTWIAGYDYSQTTFMEDILLLDRANRNIGDKIYIDPFRIRNLFNKNVNESASVFFYLKSILEMHNFTCLMHPGYINYYNVQEVKRQAVPKSEGTLEFANNLFGTFLNVDTRSSSPKLVCTYSAIPSEHLQTSKNDINRFRNDSFELKRASEVPLLERLENKEDWALSNKVVGFNVDIGIRNQNVFYSFEVSQNLGKETVESLAQMDNTINQYNGRGGATQNVSLWEFYRKRSYQCSVSCLGNVMIQPTMYFNLKYVPMFNGSYYITSVSHSISPGRFDTTFKGIRQQIFALPDLDNYLQVLSKTLLKELKYRIKSIATTTTTAQTSTVEYKNTNKIDSSNNCQSKLASQYTNYLPVVQTVTTLNVADMVSGIKTNISGGLNPILTQVMSFVTIYLASYKGNVFSSWNNNFCGAQLRYEDSNGQFKNWPGDVANAYFKKEFMCERFSDNVSYPMVVFEDTTKMFKFLESRWRTKQPLVADNENILRAWFISWNAGKTDNEYISWKNANPTLYSNYLSAVSQAIELGKANGLSL